MRTEAAAKKLPVLLLVSCVVLLAGSAESKDHNRVFSGRVVNAANHGVQGVIVHLRPQNAAADQTGSESSGTGGNLCPPPELCQITAHNGSFTFHQVKTGMYDLTVSREAQVIYTQPEPLLIPEMPTSTHLEITLPQPPQN
ncbi:MAG: carboxypeptidase-like regulatory domain-containing protein [Candidatus Korobacteraceae bacterium]